MPGGEVRFAAAALVCVLLVACAGARTSGERQWPWATSKVRVIHCAMAKPIVEAYRRSAFERYWRALEGEIEEPLRKVIEPGYLASSALASLEYDMLSRYDWSLTRYLVRLLRELEAEDLPSARALLGNEAYAEHVLDDAMWDGTNGWRVVRLVRAQTLEILRWLDDVRTGRAGEDDLESEETPMAMPALVAEAQRVTDRLFEAAAQPEPYSVGANCEPPDDPALLPTGGRRSARNPATFVRS